MRIIWLSANKFGFELLSEAQKIKGADIISIITLSESSKTVMYDGISLERWYEFGIDVLEVDNVNDSVYQIKALKPDLIVMAGWRQILLPSLLEIPTKGIVGFHPTLLPKGRGPAPIINSILNNVDYSGLTMFYVTDGLDNGDIIGQNSFDIDSSNYAMDVYEKCIISGKKLISKYMPKLVDGTAPRTPQDNSQATFFNKRSLDQNEINLTDDSPDEILRKVKALSRPYKGAFIKLGNKKLIIWEAELE